MKSQTSSREEQSDQSGNRPADDVLPKNDKIVLFALGENNSTIVASRRKAVNKFDFIASENDLSRNGFARSLLVESLGYSPEKVTPVTFCSRTIAMYFFGDVDVWSR